MVTQKWFFIRKGMEFGPVSTQQLRMFAASGQLCPTDTVWKEGTDKKVLASKVRGLAFSTDSILAGRLNIGDFAAKRWCKSRPPVAPSFLLFALFYIGIAILVIAFLLYTNHTADRMPIYLVGGLGGVAILAEIVMLARDNQHSADGPLPLPWVVGGGIALLLLFLATLATTQNGDRDISFKKLATEKEMGLKQLLDKTASRNFWSKNREDDGILEFGSLSAGVEIGWKAKYTYKNGKWKYLSSERQLRNNRGQPQWSSGDMSHNKTDIEILRVLN